MKGLILFIFRERGQEGEREGEKHQWMVASHVALTGALACNPGMCPDWESNQQPFGSQPVFNPLSYTSQGLLKLYTLKKKNLIYLFLERGREGEKYHLVASRMPLTGDLGHNPGMCPDWELKQ